MNSSTSCIINIANLFIELCGYNDEDYACLQGLKQIFIHHKAEGDAPIHHRIVVFPFRQFHMAREATLQWMSPCLGVAGLTKHRGSFLSRLFSRNKVIPLYSGTCDVLYYRDDRLQTDYYMTENSAWRIEHHADGHVTYVFSDERCKMSDGLAAMLVNVIGCQYGCYLLFASCVAIHGKALLFTGHSGIGKSTLCMDLLSQGATYIGDDLVLIYQEGKQAMVGSLLFPIKFYANQMQIHKQEMDATTHFSQHPLLHAPLQSIFFMQRADSPASASYLCPMPRYDMMEKILKFTNRANVNTNGWHFVNTVSDICGSVRCHYLYYGDRDSTGLSFFGHS